MKDQWVFVFDDLRTLTLRDVGKQDEIKQMSVSSNEQGVVVSATFIRLPCLNRQAFQRVMRQGIWGSDLESPGVERQDRYEESGNRDVLICPVALDPVETLTHANT